MAMQSKSIYLDLADYFAAEAKNPHKHEYVDGETYAMAGASRRHNQLVGNIQGHAWSAARHTKHCQVFGSDMKLYIEARNSVYYPDLSASCDPDDNNQQYLTRPCLIVEVLSPSTASIDRREKRINYETLPSLREYVIVDQDRLRAYVYTRQASVWLVQVLRKPEETVEFSCLDLRLTLQQIYENVELPPDVIEEQAPEYGPIGASI